MTRPSLGVLITYHDERDLLRECLESVLSQDPPPDEVLVYDDASLAPAEGYLPSGAAVRVIRGEINHGPAAGRNVLLRAAQAEYIHFHDADDLFHPAWSRRVRDTIERTAVDVVFTEVQTYVGDQLASQHTLGLASLATVGDLVSFSLRGVLLTPSGTYRRSTVLAVGGYREGLWQSEDFDFHVRLAASGINYAVVPEPLVIQRVRPGGRSQNGWEVWTSKVQSIEALSRELPSRYRVELADAAVRAGAQLLRLGARSEARSAFELARRLGPPAFHGQRPVYRFLGLTLGPERTERLAALYRQALPVGLRRQLASWT